MAFVQVVCPVSAASRTASNPVLRAVAGMAFFGSTNPPTAEEAAKLATCMPMLHGHPLEAPRFHKTKWKVGQTFTSRDDPDRTQEPWTPPPFVFEKDAAMQSEATVCEELVIPRGALGQRFARVVQNVLDEESCESLLKQVNSKGFTPALLNIGMGKQRLTPDVRDGHRIIVDSPELAAWLFKALEPHLPAVLDDGSQLVEFNERLRFLCYTPGQTFEEHMDGCFRREHGHPRAGDASRVTVQIYLHDVPESFGGATTFFPGCVYSVKHQPITGSALLFTQDLLHEGSCVREGLKYTIRTEAMYSKKKFVASGDRYSNQNKVRPAEVASGVSPHMQPEGKYVRCEHGWVQEKNEPAKLDEAQVKKHEKAEAKNGADTSSGGS